MNRPFVKGRTRIRLRDSIDGAPEEDGGIYFSSEKKNYQFIPSGCTVLDCVLGGGWPLGRVVNIVGDRSTGKTLLAMEAIANFFLKYDNGWVRYVEAESAFDEDYAKALGIPMGRVEEKHDLDTVEAVFGDLDNTYKKKPGIINDPGLYIIDSLDALSDAAEMEREIGQGSFGAAKAKKLSELFRRLVRRLTQQNICVMIISQVRDNIGAMFGEKHSRSGGKALDFYASQILWLSQTKTLRRTISKIERPYAVRIKARCKKNKIGLPFRECEFNIRFGYGIEDIEAGQEFLQTVGKAAPKTPEALREAVIREWYNVEKRFLPEKRKYE